MAHIHKSAVLCNDRHLLLVETVARGGRWARPVHLALAETTDGTYVSTAARNFIGHHGRYRVDSRYHGPRCGYTDVYNRLSAEMDRRIEAALLQHGEG